MKSYKKGKGMDTDSPRKKEGQGGAGSTKNTHQSPTEGGQPTRTSTKKGPMHPK
jgi:hypothetical protein